MRLSPSDFGQALEPGTVVILGEVHGTSEFPDLVAEIIYHLLLRNVPVGVALELTRDDQHRFTTYLRSAGGEEAERDLLAGASWVTRDGRGSNATLSLIRRLREYRLHDGSVFLNLLDLSYVTAEIDGRGAPPRDQAMADRLIDFADDLPEAVIVVLCGTAHAHTGYLTHHPGVGVSSQPMGWYLRQAVARVVSLKGVHNGGSAWCRTDKGEGIHPFRGVDLGARRFVELDNSPPPGYQGIAYVTQITASRPAVTQFGTSHPTRI